MIKIILIGLAGTAAAVMLKNSNSELSYLSAVITGVIIIGFLYNDIDGLVSTVNIFKDGYGISDEYIKLLVKVLGISYITQFGVSVAEDCGEKGIAKKFEFAGRIFILSLCVPIFIKLLNTILGLI